MDIKIMKLKCLLNMKMDILKNKRYINLNEIFPVFVKQSGTFL